jgi:hypothetical protein
VTHSDGCSGISLDCTASALSPESANLCNRRGLAGVVYRKAPHAVAASGSRRAATIGCEAREGAGQTVMET